ncbi:MAG: hypothetical protein HQL88_06545 [Magnetococcales bacterium]|nr:hypothetical protein [Magnetococcales bacterium]
MRKPAVENSDMRLLAQFERTCGEMPPADLLDPSTFGLFVKQVSRHMNKLKKTGKRPQ